jgi:hypothetical protein
MWTRVANAEVWQEFGPVGWAVVMVAGLGLWGFAATATRPGWSPGWSGWAFTFLGITLAAFGVLGVLIRITHKTGVSDKRARDLERAHADGRDILSALRSPDGWREFLDLRSPRDLLLRIERWRERTRRLVPARDHEKWDRIWTSDLAEAPRSRAREDIAVNRRAEWQLRMLRALDLLKRLLNETGPARPETDPEHVKGRIMAGWEEDDEGPNRAAPRSPRRTRHDR